MKKLITASILLLSTYVIASPFITLKQTEIALANKDAATLKKTIDFESVKNTMAAQMLSASDDEKSGFAALGAVIAMQMLDRLLTPEGITELMGGNTDTDFEIVKVNLVSINSLIVDVDSGDKVTSIIMSRDIINWRITGFGN